METRSTASRRQRALTLLELIVVITIIGILMSMVAPRAVRWLTRGRFIAAEHDLQAIVKAATMHFTETAIYPDAIDAVDLDRTPVDPWGRPYLYEVTDDGPRAWTYGRDGEPGGDGEDGDVFWPPVETP